MSALSDVVTASKLKAARNAARGGDYQLLLGAGASIGAVNKNGELPLAGGLVRILAARYPKAPIDEGDTLPRAYQRALHVSSNEDVWAVMREIFSNVNHEAWFADLAGLPWRRVWTLNVDDAFENSYRRTLRATRLPIATINWDEPYSERADLEVVHLHGHVLGSSPRRLVFSLNEYQSLARDRPVWDSILAGVVAASPMIIIGAKLLDDPDMERLIMPNRPTAEAPSIIVDPYISESNQWELERSGFVVLKLTAEEFVRVWCSEFDLSGEDLKTLYENESINLPQLRSLETNRFPPAPRFHDYFGGDEPLWSDAILRYPAFLGWMKSVVEAIEAWSDGQSEPELHILYSDRLTGVSSGMLLVGRIARGMHIKVLQFDKSSRFNVPLLLDLLRGRGPTLLMVDGAADFADDLDQLLIGASAADDVQLYILVSENKWKDLQLEGRLGGAYRKSLTKIPSWLHRGDATKVVQKLREFGRLGALEMMTDRQQGEHFVNRDIFSAMLDVEYAVGFRGRIESEIRGIDAQWQRELLLLLSLASQGGLRVGVGEAAIALDRSADQLIQLTRSDQGAAALIESSDGLIRARQRDQLLPSIIGPDGAKGALETVRSMVVKLAPLATRGALRERNRSAVLVAYLVNYKQLNQNFGAEDLDPFYEALRSTYGDWNGRYWEQRAIYAKHQGDWARAESFAARSVSLVDDPYSQTTYGTILINKAESLAAAGDLAWHSYYARGREQLETARLREPSNKITYFAYLEALLSLIRSVLRSESAEHLRKSEEFLDSIDGWRAAYSELRVTIRDEDGLNTRDRAEILSTKFMTVVGQ